MRQLTREYLELHWEQLLWPLCVLAVTLLVGYAVKQVLLKVLRGWAVRTRGQAAHIVTNAIAGPFMIWVLILGMHLATESSAAPPEAHRWLSRTFLVLWILSLTIMGSRLAGNLIQLYGSRGQGVLPVTTLTQTLAQLAVVLLGMVLLLNGLGISITPILTALGVGGLAVALALQDTLANLFAGFYVAVAGQVRPGDYIRLNTGEEGYVMDIGWRSTTMRALSNNMVIVPNNKLGQAIVTNFYLPEKHLGASIVVNVDRDADEDRVEQLLLDVARGAVNEVPGLLANPAPSVMFDPGVSEWSLGFTVGYEVAEFGDQTRVRHELRKRVLRRLRREGIGLPFPTRTVYMRETGTP
jgi:small-conductance mechanosensitive channel